MFDEKYQVSQKVNISFSVPNHKDFQALKLHLSPEAQHAVPPHASPFDRKTKRELD
jgi:hypothetical protein